MTSKVQTIDWMLDIDGVVVRVGDRVAFVTTSYGHCVSFRTGKVVKIRINNEGKSAASVQVQVPNYDYKTGKYDGTFSAQTIAMSKARLAKIG